MIKWKSLYNVNVQFVVQFAVQFIVQFIVQFACGVSKYEEYEHTDI